MGFYLEKHSSLLIPNNNFTVPHRPVPAIPEEKSSNLNETDNVYLVAKEIPKSLIKDDDKSEIVQTKTLEEESTSVEDKVKEKKA